jgi:ABC-type antimicrobial peptide transport system permease subunit
MVTAVAVATAAFTVLTGAADTATVVARNTVSDTGPSAYDILVRPRGSQTPIERASGEVRPGFLDGVFGGITMRQYHQISALPGVEVAAPVAMVGYTTQDVLYSLPLRKLTNSSTRQLFKISVTTTTDRGLSHVPIPASYVYVTQRRLHNPPRRGSLTQIDQPVKEVEAGGRQIPVCGGGDPRYSSPYRAEARSSDLCFSQASRRSPIAIIEVAVPLLIEAVDPRAEAALDRLNGAVINGRYLNESDRVDSVKGTQADLSGRTFPVLVSSRNYLDDSLSVSVRRLPGTAADGVLHHRLQTTVNTDRGTGPVVLHRSFGVSPAYRQVVRQLRGVTARDVFSPIDGLWRVKPATFEPSRPGGPVTPVQVAASRHAWKSEFQFDGYVTAPADNRDTSYRTLQHHVATNNTQDSLPAPVAVGVFNPDLIEPFNPLTHVPLGGYEPTPAAPADARSRALLHGKDLLPNSNLAGYLGQPPQLVTTLKSLRALENSQAFTGSLSARDPISAIRVRVTGATGIGGLSRARVNLVAQDIIERTGLQVDITTGSSPSTQVTDLPAGKFGRPALALREGWVAKNVVPAIARAIDRKSLLLFILVLVVCALFVLNAATAAVRARRRQLAILACLGWSPRQLFVDVVSEQAIVGLTAGLLGVAIAVPVAAASGLHLDAARIAVAVVAATLLTMAAAVPPAVAASRARPIEATRPSVRRYGTHRAVRGLTGLALRHVIRARARSAIAVVGLALGVCSSIFLLAVTTSFNGQLAGDLLGQAVTIRVRGVDYAAVAVMLAIGGFGLADVLYLNIRERAAELAALQATGWSRRSVARLVAAEGVAMGLAGALVGAVLGVVLITDFTSESVARAVPLASIALGVGVALGAVATVLPMSLLPRRLAESLAED